MVYHYSSALHLSRWVVALEKGALNPFSLDPPDLYIVPQSPYTDRQPQCLMCP